MTPNDFAGRTALVTGASAGMGFGIAQALLDRGATVIAVARRPVDIDHPRLVNHPADLSDPTATARLADDLRARGDVDILVNNAGIVRNTPLEEITANEFDQMVNLHMRTAILLAQAVAPGMKDRGFGRIVNMSTRAVVGLAQRTVYAGTKAALISMTRTWALEMGPFGITVNAIAPGPVVTPMLTEGLPEDGEAAARLAASLPMRRLGTIEDLTRATLFFADPENSWITGQTLFVCGGGSLGASIAL